MLGQIRSRLSERSESSCCSTLAHNKESSRLIVVARRSCEMGRANEVHRNIGVDENQGCGPVPYPFSRWRYRHHAGRDLLEKLVSDRQRLVTDAQVLQEILYRYVAICRRDAIQPAFDALLGVVDQVLPVDRAVAERAKQIVLGRRQMSARDAVHLAVMEQHGIDQILTFDSGFDGFPGITRLS